MAGRRCLSRGVLRAATSSVVVPRRPRSAPVAAPAPAAPEQDAVPARDAVPPHGTHLRQRPAPPPQPRAVNFSDAREAFRSKTSGQLLRGLLVLRLCALEPLVQRAEQLMHLSQKLLGQWLFEKLMKLTFYGQFVAGEDQEAIKPLIRHNRAYGVGSVLDYKQREKRYSVHHKFGDRRDGVTGARTYFYADEAKCDRHMETFVKCIEASGEQPSVPPLSLPQSKLQFSEVLVKWRSFFHQLAAEQGKVGLAALETKLEVEKLQEALANLGIATKAESQQWFAGEKLGLTGTVDLLDWNSLIDARMEISKLLLTGQLEPLLSRFTQEEERQMKRMLQRMDVLAKEAYDNVTIDVELSRREGWHFGAKLVRGAYMEQERSRAAEVGYEDPINPTYEKTSEMYHRCLDYILEEIRHSRKANVMVASHNTDTVKFTLGRMADLGIHPSENKIYFGQLLGMCDQITFPLGQAGFPVYKYVPYGPVKEVLPYLSRRAQENRGLLVRAEEERQLLWTELKRRVFAGALFNAPSPP
ncbi:hypothetical protein Chor_000010 [Crotalus horridus]